MFENRISEQFGTLPDVAAMVNVSNRRPANVPPMASLQDIYKAAAELALRDHELDKLFNAEHYGDHGSGI